MSLEARLTALADDAFPPTPDLAAAVTGHLGGANHPSRGFNRPRVVAAVVAALLIPAGTVAAVELWGPERVRVRTTTTLPPPPATTPEAGAPVASLEEAAQRAGFTPTIPPFLDAPPSAVTARPGLVSFEAGTALVTEADARLFVDKTIGMAGDVERLTVDGAEALYIRGEHDVVIETDTGFDVLPRRRVGDVLVYEQDGIVIRVEGLTAPPRSPAP